MTLDLTYVGKRSDYKKLKNSDGEYGIVLFHQNSPVGYITFQTSLELDWDYTIYNSNFVNIDGGCILGTTLRDAINFVLDIIEDFVILRDLDKMPDSYSFIDYENLLDLTEVCEMPLV